MDESAKEFCHVPNEGNIIIAFDNDQVIGKTWRVHVHNKVRVSVITTVLNIISEPSSSLQKTPHFVTRTMATISNEFETFK